MSWLALTTRPRYEMSAAELLAGKSLEVYVPTYRQRIRWSDRIKIVEKPLFPGYIFCNFEFDDRLKVLRTSGVTSIVSLDGSPYPISETELETVRRIALACDLSIVPHPFVRVGERVRIGRGPLAGLEGILVREKRKWRVVVAIEAMRRAVALEIDASMIEPSSPRRPKPYDSALGVPVAS